MEWADAAHVGPPNARRGPRLIITRGRSIPQVDLKDKWRNLVSKDKGTKSNLKVSNKKAKTLD